MATGSWPTLLDLGRRLDPQGKIDAIAEMLSQSNEYFDDAVWKEANEIGGHKFTFRTSIPGGAWRMYNQGVGYSKSTTAQATVSIGSLEAYSQVDRMIAEDSGDAEGYRESEDVAFLEGMAQTFNNTQFYGNTVVTPAQFMGLSPFYNTLSTATAQNASNVINAGGTGNSNLSFWMIGHGERTMFNVYPRGSKAGLAMEDKGDTTPGFDNLGNRFEAYTSWFRQQGGFCPQDWRSAVRIANVDVTNAGLAGPNAYDIFAGFAQAVMLLPTATRRSSGITKTDAPDEPNLGTRIVIYTNRTGRHWMDVQAMRNRNTLLRIEDYAGIPVMGWRDFPIKLVDQLLTTEAALT